MDASTLETLRKHPDIDRAAETLVRLLAACKSQQMHGKAGVLVELKAGAIALLHESKDSTTLIKI